MSFELPEPDALAKAVASAIWSVAQTPGERQALRAANVQAFVTDRPDTTDPVSMAAHAFLYLARTEDGHWSASSLILKGVLAYLGAEGYSMPTAARGGELRALLDRNPARPQEIEAWFKRAFPVPP